MTCNTRSTWQGVAATVHCTRGEKILICGIATGTAGCEGNRFPLFFVSNLEGRRKWRNETGTVIGRRDRVSFMRLNLGFSTAETRPIMAVNATIYLQFLVYAINKIYIIHMQCVLSNPVPQQCEREFQGHVSYFCRYFLRLDSTNMYTRIHSNGYLCHYDIPLLDT